VRETPYRRRNLPTLSPLALEGDLVFRAKSRLSACNIAEDMFEATKLVAK